MNWPGTLGVWRKATVAWAGHAWMLRWSLSGMETPLAVALVLGIAAFVGWRVIRRLRGWLGQGRAAARPRVGFYRKLEAILRRHGFRRDPGVTPLEFVRSVIASAGERYAPAATVAEAFCRVRYGARHLSPPERAAVARALAALERARRQIRISHQPSKSRRDGRT